MPYTIRRAGTKSKMSRFIQSLELIAFLGKWLGYVVFGLAIMLAILSANYGALAVMSITGLILGIGFNMFKLRLWLPGWQTQSWLVRAVALTLYLFILLSALLLTTP